MTNNNDTSTKDSYLLSRTIREIGNIQKSVVNDLQHEWWY